MGNTDYKFKKLFRILSVVLAAVFILSFITAGTYTDNSVIGEVRNYLKSYYVDELPDSVLNKPTIDEIISEINKTDPHTMYFTAKKFSDFTNSINNTFSGIGVQVEIVSEGVEIISVFDGSPAKAAGIKSGDIIMMAANHMLRGLPDDVALGYIKGVEGTTVNLKVKRGTELLNMNVVRRQISAPTVTNEIVDKHIGLIRVVSFGQDTASKFTDIINECEKKKVDSYIIDLRNNPGGYLDVALDMAGHFIGNQVALITRSRIEGELKQYGVAHSSIINKPVIFLINGYSASASEVLSGAVKDYNKAYFLGTKSYGKGSVQWPVELSNKDVLKFTIERFYSPKGNTINMVGITPDLNVPDEIDSMRVAELMFDSPKNLKDNRGYVKITIKDKTTIVNINRVNDLLYWQAYKQMLSLANADGSGSVMLGTQKGWTKLSKSYVSNYKKMFYPTYKEIPKLSNIKTNMQFTIKFKSKVKKSSLNSKNIELIDVSTGIRVPVLFSSSNDKQVVVTPKENLKKAKTYYLVVNPKVLKSDNKPLGYGTVNEIQTIK